MEDSRYLGRMTDAEYSEYATGNKRRRKRGWYERMTEEEYAELWDGEPPEEETEKKS